MHSQGKTNTGPATRAMFDRWLAQVDPDGVLAPEERARRAILARKAHMAALALKASRARSAKRPIAVWTDAAKSADASDRAEK